MSCNRSFVFAFAVVFCAASAAHASKITSVTKVTGTGTVATGILADGALAFTDRTHVLKNLPSGLLGSEYVRLANDAKSNATYQVDVTTNSLALLYVFLDNRYGEGGTPNANDPPTGLPGWMTDGSVGLGPFQSTGVQLDIDESNDGDIDNFYTAYVTLAQAGTHSFREQNDGGGRNMYVIAVSRTLIPEPGSLALAGLGVAGVLAYGVRRRRSAA